MTATFNKYLSAVLGKNYFGCYFSGPFGICVLMDLFYSGISLGPLVEVSIRPLVLNTEVSIRPLVLNTEVFIRPLVPNTEVFIRPLVLNTEVSIRPLVLNTEVSIQPLVLNTEVSIRPLVLNTIQPLVLNTEVRRKHIRNNVSAIDYCAFPSDHLYFKFRST